MALDEVIHDGHRGAPRLEPEDAKIREPKVHALRDDSGVVARVKQYKRCNVLVSWAGEHRVADVFPPADVDC